MDGDKVLYDRNWRAPDTVAEVIEAVSNLTDLHDKELFIRGAQLEWSGGYYFDHKYCRQ